MNLLAALIFFTRLPFWRIKEVPAECFKHVVPYWPFVGWITGGITAAVLWLCGQVFPISLAWIIAIVTRLLITGCLHEDGFADFLDGFGGGTTRERILAIMKDSHLGTYGVIGLIAYFCIIAQICIVPIELLCIFVLCGDCWSKCVASQIANILPYARKEEESKAKSVNSPMNTKERLIAIAGGLIPGILLLPLQYAPAMLCPILTFIVLCLIMKRRIQGYTGDCCGALVVTGELSYYLGCLIIWRLF